MQEPIKVRQKYVKGYDADIFRKGKKANNIRIDAPQAKPSIPSIQLIAFVTPPNHKVLKIKLRVTGIEKTCSFSKPILKNIFSTLIPLYQNIEDKIINKISL